MSAPSDPLHELAGLGAGEAPARPRLLVVDDDAINVQALYRAFGEDHQVLMATSGEQALRLAAARRPDLILLDVAMPDLDGVEVCRRLKADPATAAIPVIFVTGHDGEDAETRGLDAGAVDYIGKPINPRIVRARVRTHLTLKRQADLLRQWVYIDGLTGVANRRHFDERLAVDWRRAQRERTPLSLMLVDVDQFKLYNDRYGHQAGDDCLRRVAALASAEIRRPGDLLARYGGEEFAMLLPDTPAEGAARLAARLVERVFAEGLVHETSRVAPVVTVSVGAATARPSIEGGDVERLVRLADRRLYEAKLSGRNRACPPTELVARA
ncbi:MAG TPA: diguanylate cyclase [Burkholderiaceae bacterium]|nr:diguanylate cyclase [Burkholderiaceae bacterium]